MEITYTKHINTQKNNRIEFWLINYDYIDGNDYLAKLFSEEYGFIVEEKIDGLWYSIIRVHLNSCIYELLWHEDTGNEIYCLNQTEEENHVLQQRLEGILSILNARIKERQNPSTSLMEQKIMKRIDIKSNEDIEELHKQYGNFEDSYMVSFSFESGNYVDDERIGYEADDNILIVKFERLDDNPFSIELMFEHTRRINYLFPLMGRDNWTSGLTFAKVVRNDEFYYWTVWKEFDPYNNEHLEFNDFILIEAKKIKWRVKE